MIYLYVKQHSLTKLKYFGKTIRNPFKYNGSGVHWVRHYKKHGRKFINTLDVFGFDNQEAATEFALNFSRIHNIVESSDWANLAIETAKDGVALHGNKNGMYNKTHSDEAKFRIGEATRTNLKNKSYVDIHGIEKANQLKSSRRKIALNKNNTGSHNPRYDSNIYTFINAEEMFIGTRFDFYNKYKLPKSSVYNMIKTNSCCRGWTIA